MKRSGVLHFHRIALLAAVVLLAGLFLCGERVHASEKDTSGDAGSCTFFDDDTYTDLKNITVPFLDTIDVVFTWNFPYSDEFFNTPPTEFSPAFARGSLGFASSTFRSVDHTVKLEYETYLKGAGFGELHAFGYDKPTRPDSLSGVIGQKQIGDFTVIAAAACGQGYDKEWSGNLKVGAGDRHEGFSEAAGIMEKELRDYISSHHIDGKKKLWLTGYSRAAAVANLTAADMIASGDFADVYAYLFGVPRTIKQPAPYVGIYNIMGQFDPVPEVPLQSWGFERYGTDLYTPAQESDTGYTPLAVNASAVSKKLQHDSFRNNPELNYQLHLVEEFMGELFPTSQDYARRFQDILMDTWQTPDPSNIHTTLASALSQMSDMSTAEENAADVFVNYLTFVAGQHVRADQRQVEDGSWDPNEQPLANLVLEHRIATYLKWLFSDNPAEEVYRSAATENTRRITFLGDIGLEVWMGNTLLRSIDSQGNVTTPDTDASKSDSAELLPRPFLMRNGKELVTSIPKDGNYRLVITSDSRHQLTYYDVSYQAGLLNGQPGVMRMGTLPGGRFTMDIFPGSTLPAPSNEKGSLSGFVLLPMDYSAAIMMHNELDATSDAFISVNQLARILLDASLLLLVLLIVCLIIYYVHKKHRQQGHPPYSDLYVIIPHLIPVVLFSVQTQFLSYFMFSVVEARAVCAALAVLSVLVLQLRATLKQRTAWNMSFTILFAVLIPAIAIFYRSIAATSYSNLHTLGYFLIMAAFALIAVRSYRGSLRSSENYDRGLI